MAEPAVESRYFPSLRLAVTQTKPQIQRRNLIANTNAPTHFDARNCALEWHVFKAVNMQGAHRNLLNEQIKDDDIKFPTIGNTMRCPIAWAHQLMQVVLPYTQAKLAMRQDLVVESRVNIHIPAKRGRGIDIPHLIGFREGRGLVVGMRAADPRWSGKDVIVSLAATGKLSLRHAKPLSELAKACTLENARYGYILSNDEFVACRIQQTEVPNKPASFTVEIMPVKWTQQSNPHTVQPELTADLALWWLAVLGMRDSDQEQL
ncbi:hypothetical protein S7711_10633 [Stachybotrys chartarum IBT 7711]|uniref:Uncharacterized protein n=1 Tax=Stachybotrys chartarum (strain CBS 109288 / IBT 7711) TaxID=1280523 RepID=A0A084AH35_STACB|nr:hypothetical protein S7711_10633 [Stachybotrys chartarum IBT 7711]KFA56293.1 hypothetical protein S40293_10350 [Stachybotrys chartarum IBT 40293]